MSQTRTHQKNHVANNQPIQVVNTFINFFNMNGNNAVEQESRKDIDSLNTDPSRNLMIPKLVVNPPSPRQPNERQEFFD